MLDFETTLASAVRDHAACASVFLRHHIDYCCRGKRTIAEACRERGLDPAMIVSELQQAIKERGRTTSLDPAEMSSAELIGHVMATYHAYLRKSLPFAIAMSAKVRAVHGGRDPRLIAVEEAVQELWAALEPHLDFEERVLFPALMSGTADRTALARDLASMEADHAVIGESLVTLRALTDDFRPPIDACFSYRVLLQELRQLEADTLRHVHLENHVLMPRFA